MTHYLSDTFDPRPEFYAYVLNFKWIYTDLPNFTSLNVLIVLSYDVQIAKQLNNQQDQDEYLCRVKAASESGWGFSSKHFHDRVNYDNIESKV